LYLAVVELVAFRLVLLRCDRSMTGPQVAHEAKRNAACPDSFRRGNLFTLYHDTFFGRSSKIPAFRLHSVSLRALNDRAAEIRADGFDRLNHCCVTIPEFD